MAKNDGVPRRYYLICYCPETTEWVMCNPDWNPGEDAPMFPTREAAEAAAAEDAKATDRESLLLL